MKPQTGHASYADGILTITVVRTRGPFSAKYIVTDLRPDPQVASPAFALEQEDGTEYLVWIDEWGPQCNCQDTEYRARRCKHVQALTAVGLLPRQRRGNERA